MARKDKSLFDSEIVESGRRRARGTEAVGVEMGVLGCHGVRWGRVGVPG